MVAITGVIGAMAVVLLPRIEAHAEGCGTFQNLQVGNWSVGAAVGAYEGASANVSFPAEPTLCSTDTAPGTNFSTSWTMVFESEG